MLPLTICKCAEQCTPEHATAVAEIIDKAFKDVFGRVNRLPRTNFPVVCASLAGIQGFWSLECNDPEVDRDLLVQVIEKARPEIKELVDNEQSRPR